MRPPQGGKIHVINIFVPNKTANFSGIQFSTTLKIVWQTQFQVIERLYEFSGIFPELRKNAM